MAETLIYKAITAVMEEVGAVGKNNVNESQKYKFRGIDDVMNALHPVMSKHKVFCTPTVLDVTREERQNRQGNTLVYSVATVKYTFYTVDGSSVETVVVGEAMDSGDKSLNKALSAAFKYSCFQTFCIPTEEMHDSEEDTYEVAPKKTSKKKEAEVDPKDTVKAAYPTRDEMIAQIAEHYADDKENFDKMLTFFKVKSLNECSDAQIMTVWSKKVAK